jgi:hypothetical protein
MATASNPSTSASRRIAAAASTLGRYGTMPMPSTANDRRNSA